MVSGFLVTIHTRANHKVVIDLKNITPTCRKLVMTSIALVNNRDVIGRLTTGIGTVMTADTTTNKAGMIRRAGATRPTRGIVTNITFRGSNNVIRPLAARSYAIMTA